ncbi:MAG TPA: Fic/DOC family N-terminal domain-containing protein, partial [Longimicrobiales bacterium]|nr:Fic/DOC family N-terminal domain-containing protein [Longimicrobiales bacterium]
MRGELVTRTWEWNPILYAPPKYRRACRYEAFIPERLAGTHFSLSTTVAGGVSEAEHAISSLNARATPALAPLARLLLRTESIASSKVEGLQVGVAQLARAEATIAAGGSAAPTVLEVLRNIEAMQVAVDEAASADRIVVEHILGIHRTLMAGATGGGAAGTLRASQNWIG